MINALLSLLNRLTPNRANLLDNLDNLNTTISSRAPSSSALLNTTWTPTIASKIDYLSVTIGSRAPSSSALSTAQWTNSRANLLDNLFNLNATISSRSTLTAENVWTYGSKLATASSIPSVINRIQSGTTTLNNTSIEVTLANTVNLSKAFCVFSVKPTAYVNLQDMSCTVELSQTNKLLIIRTGSAASVVVHWQVVEFK